MYSCVVNYKSMSSMIGTRHFLLIMGVVSLIASIGCKRANRIIFRNDPESLAHEGSQMTPAEAIKLEKNLEINPNDLESRTLLIGYYWYNHFRAPNDNAAHTRHAIWVIEHIPEQPLAGIIEMQIFSHNTGDYETVSDIWMKQVRAHPSTAAVSGHAGHYFLLSDPPRAESLYIAAEKLDPRNPQWPEGLWNVYRLALIHPEESHIENAREKSLPALELARALSRGKIKEAYLLENLPETAFESGNNEKARIYSEELLTWQPTIPIKIPFVDIRRFQKRLKITSPFAADSAHAAYTVLGRVALREGNKTSAMNYLKKSADVAAGGNLNIFGPKMTLAAELFQQGEREGVIDYLQNCKKFQAEKRGHCLDEWLALIRADKTPDFNRCRR